MGVIIIRSDEESAFMFSKVDLLALMTGSCLEGQREVCGILSSVTVTDRL